ncbi:hypothetical protein M144_4425, partial [Bacteroides fragilis str. 3-F-2 
GFPTTSFLVHPVYSRFNLQFSGFSIFTPLLNYPIIYFCRKFKR